MIQYDKGIAYGRKGRIALGTKKRFRIIIISLIILAAAAWCAIMSMSLTQPYFMPSMFLTEAVYGTMRELAEVNKPNMTGLDIGKDAEITLSGEVRDLSEAAEFGSALFSAEGTVSGEDVRLSAGITRDLSNTVYFSAEKDNEKTVISTGEEKITLTNSEFGRDWNLSESAVGIFGFTLPEELSVSVGDKSSGAGISVYDFYNNANEMTKGARIRRERSGDIGVGIRCYNVSLESERARENICAMITALADGYEDYSVALTEAAEHLESAELDDRISIKIWTDADAIYKAIAEFRVNGGRVFAWFDATDGARIRDNISFGVYSTDENICGFLARMQSRKGLWEASVRITGFESGNGEYGYSESKIGDDVYIRCKTADREGSIHLSQDKSIWTIKVPYARIESGSKEYVLMGTTLVLDQ